MFWPIIASRALSLIWFDWDLDDPIDIWSKKLLQPKDVKFEHTDYEPQ
jgi:hypothetical protein